MSWRQYSPAPHWLIVLLVAVALSRVAGGGTTEATAKLLALDGAAVTGHNPPLSGGQIQTSSTDFSREVKERDGT